MLNRIFIFFCFVFLTAFSASFYITGATVTSSIGTNYFPSAGFPISLSSGFFDGGVGPGGGSTGPFLYGTSSMNNFEYSNPFSVCAWIIASRGDIVQQGAQVIAAKLNTTQDGTVLRGWQFEIDGVYIGNNAASLAFQLANGPTARAAIFPPDGTPDIFLGQWNHVCATSNGSGLASGMKLYANGNLATFSTQSDTLSGATIINSVPFSIGGITTNSGEGYEKFNGNINEVSIWNVALSGAQITALYNGGLRKNPRAIGPVANLTSYYPLASPSDNSSTINDLVGSNNLTNQSVTLAGIVPPAPAYQNASSGSFDGAASYVDLGNTFGTNIGTSAVSYSIWLNLTSLPSAGTYYAVFHKQNATGPGMHFYVNNAPHTDPSSLNFQIVGLGGGAIIINGPTGVFSTGVWENIIVTYDGSQSASGVHIYKNGVALSTTTQSDTLSANADNGDSFQLGQFQGIRFYDGLMDEFAIFNAELNSTQVTDLFNGEGGDLSGWQNLVGWYRFENAGQYTGYAPDLSTYIGNRAPSAGGLFTATNNGVTFSSTVP